MHGQSSWLAARAGASGVACRNDTRCSCIAACVRGYPAGLHGATAREGSSASNIVPSDPTQCPLVDGDVAADVPETAAGVNVVSTPSLRSLHSPTVETRGIMEKRTFQRHDVLRGCFWAVTYVGRGDAGSVHVDPASDQHMAACAESDEAPPYLLDSAAASSQASHCREHVLLPALH